MAITKPFFTVSPDPGQHQPGHGILKSNVASPLYNGMLGSYDGSTGELVLPSACEPSFIFWDNLVMEEWPTFTSQDITDYRLGKHLAVLYGQMEVIASCGYFTGGTLPAEGADVYADSNGYYTAVGGAGAPKIGKVKKHTSRTARGVQQVENLAIMTLWLSGT